MSRLRWPNSRHSLSDVPGTVHYDFLFRPGPWCPNATRKDLNNQPEADLDSLLESWVGRDQLTTILDLSGVPVSILNDLIGVLIRLLSDALFWARSLPEGGRTRPLLFVLEEAHAYLNSGNESMASHAARRIVKEGRKCGVGAMIVSQRPGEIDPTILSQCGTIFAMRLSNATDRAQVIGGSSGIRVGMSPGLIGVQVKAAEVEVNGLAEPLTTPKASGLFLGLSGFPNDI